MIRMIDAKRRDDIGQRCRVMWCQINDHTTRVVFYLFVVQGSTRGELRIFISSAIWREGEASLF